MHLSHHVRSNYDILKAWGECIALSQIDHALGSGRRIILLHSLTESLFRCFLLMHLELFIALTYVFLRIISHVFRGWLIHPGLLEQAKIVALMEYDLFSGG